MSATDFGAMQPHPKRHWVQDSIRAFNEAFFFQKFLGEGENNIVQHVTKLKKTEKGDRAMIGLVANISGTGIVGDNWARGREKKLESSWVEIQTDLLRQSVISKGRVDEQRSVFTFRKEARDKLAIWRATIIEELMVLAASGIAFSYNTDGSVRDLEGQDDLAELAFAPEVSAPTAGRHLRFDGTNLQPGDTTLIDAASVPKYGMLVDAAAEARIQGMKPLRINGADHFVYLCDPKTMSALKKDADFRDAVINANTRGDKNPILTGGTVTIDGLIIHTNNRVFSTRGAATGSKWGTGGLVDGTRSLLMGCQALAFADLSGTEMWDEETLDSNTKHVITVGNYCGVIKPKFKTSPKVGAPTEDFGVMALDLAL